MISKIGSIIMRILGAKIIAVILIVLALFFVGPFILESLQPDPLNALDEFDYQFDYTNVQSSPVDEQPFTIVTVNCESPVVATENWESSRDFTISVSWTLDEKVSKTIARELNLNLGPSEEQKIEARLGQIITTQLSKSQQTTIGVVQRVTVGRQFLTPPNSRSTYYLQWEEIHYLGTVRIVNRDGNDLGENSFHIVRDLRLSQIGVSIEPCNPSDTPNPTVSDMTATNLPINRTPLPPATLRPFPTAPSVFVYSVKPILTSPNYGIYQNPITFTWRGSPDETHQVILKHLDKVYEYESEWLQDFTWTFSIPAEEYGNWSWYVTSQTGGTSDFGQFIFDPFPGSDDNSVPTVIPTLPTQEPALLPTPTPEPTIPPEPTTPPYPPPTSYP